MKRRRAISTSVGLTTALALSLVACGEDDDATSAAAAPEPTTPVSTAPSAGDDIARVRAATARLRRVDAAEDAGYGLPPEGPLHECISAPDGPSGMGFHWINEDLVSDAVLDPARPEAAVYEPKPGGGYRLVALEYVVFEDVWESAHPGETPRLFGRELAYKPAPNRFELPSFYEIHVWAWKRNPDGMFADFNPNVSCETAPAPARRIPF